MIDRTSGEQNVRQALLDLYEVQKIDFNIRETEGKKKAVSSKIGDFETDVRALHEQELSFQTEMTAIDKEIKTNENIIRDETFKIKKWEARLIDIKNQREYMALSREVEGPKRANKELEEKNIELLTKREEIEEKLDALEDDLAEKEIDLDTERQKMQESLKTIDEDFEHAKEQREILLKKISQNILSKYEIIRERRFGQGLAAAHAGRCTACNMRLPPQLYNILQRADTIEECPSCNRILMWEGLIPEETTTTDAASEGESAHG